MASQTTNYKLKKPGGEDYYDINVQNDNMDIIDQALKNSANDISRISNAATQQSNGLMSAADKTKLDGVAVNANNYVHPTDAGNKHVPSGGTSGQFLKYGGSSGTAAWATPAKADIGLGNVDNTSDANKPISSAAQTALNAKAPLASPAFTGNTPTTAGNMMYHAGNITISTAAPTEVLNAGYMHMTY